MRPVLGLAAALAAGALALAQYGDISGLKVAKKEDREDVKPAPPPKDDTAISLRVPLRLGPDDFGGGRRYDRALAVWAAFCASGWPGSMAPSLPWPRMSSMTALTF